MLSAGEGLDGQMERDATNEKKMGMKSFEVELSETSSPRRWRIRNLDDNIRGEDASEIERERTGSGWTKTNEGRGTTSLLSMSRDTF